jgi:hypothetical protein
MISIDLTGLRVRTAHLSYSGPGRIDLTRRSRDLVGLAFADPWAITEIWEGRLLTARTDWLSASDSARIAAALRPGPDGALEAKLVRDAATERAEERLSFAWAEFVAGYNAHVERTRDVRQDAWAELGEWAARGRPIVGVCGCDGKQAREPLRRCHRYLWAAHMAEAGASYEGEIGKTNGRREA